MRCALDSSCADEHRAVSRVRGDTVGPLRLRAEVLELSFLATVRDISVQGIGLVAEQPFAPGTLFVIESGPSGTGLPVQLTATLRHSTELSQRQWLLGCIFSRNLTTDDFAALG
jgi:hypothetical protein